MELLKETPFEAAWVGWAPRPGEHALTVAVKATYDLPEEGVATLAAAQALPRGDDHVDDDPACALRWASDLEPIKPCAECFVVGSFHAAASRPVERSLASFRVGAIEKAVAVTGDRAWKSGRPTAPASFTEMPLGWERSFGGPGHPPNPLGRGLAADATGQFRLPNLEDPRDSIEGGAARPRAYGIGPMPRTFAGRLRHAGTYDARWLAERYPGFPEDIDYRLFLAAPEDQRIQGFFSGDEPIELLHLHPTHPRVCARLPGHRARAFLADARGALTDVGLRLDTIVIDADAGQVACVWRGVTNVRDAKLTGVAHLFVAHEEPAEPRADFAERYRALLAAREEEARGAEAAPVPAPPAGGVADAPSVADIVAAFAPGPGAKWAHLDQAMTVRGDSSALSAALEDAVARRQAEQRESAFAPVFADALGLGAPVEAPELSPEEQLALEMELALAGMDEPPSPDRERVRSAIREGRSCAGWDLTGVDLSGVDLGAVDFSRAILVRANLSGAHLRGARLEGANLGEAELSYAVFYEVCFDGADLSPVRSERVRFSGCSFDGTVASDSYFLGARFAGCRFPRADFSASDLTEAHFDECTLDGADLSGSTLHGARFARSTLIDTRMEGVRAERAIFDQCDCTLLRASEQAALSFASFKRAKLDGARFGTSTLRAAIFSLASLGRADFTEAVLSQAQLVGCYLQKARFDDATLLQASLMKADLYEASLLRANLERADLRGANLFSAELLGAKLDGARLDLADVTRTRIA